MKTKFAVAKKNTLVPTIYLANISYKMNEEGLEKFLSTYGKVTYLFMPRDKKTKKTKGTAFIQYAKKHEYERAILRLNGKAYMGRTLKASQAIENDAPQKGAPKFDQVTASNSKPDEIAPPQRKKRPLKGLDLLLKR